MSDAKTHLPAEWAPHEACWMALPHLPEEWPGHYEDARDELLELARQVATTGGETLHLLVGNEDDAAQVQARVGDQMTRGEIVLERGTFGDAWTRDTLPFFVHRGAALCAEIFRFDGWGGKYLMTGDDMLADDVAARLDISPRHHDLVLEGGALEFNGAGAALTTEDSLFLRNTPRDWAETERMVKDALGLEQLFVLRGSLANDHTDGHIDTLARFTSERSVVVMRGEPGDTNADTLMKIHAQCEYMIEDHGLDWSLHTIPSPGTILDDDGAPLPASYLNFYVANEAVLVPAYGVATDEEARAMLEPLFEGRVVRSVPARHILSGGGAIHCVTHQQPVRGSET